MSSESICKELREGARRLDAARASTPSLREIGPSEEVLQHVSLLGVASGRLRDPRSGRRPTVAQCRQAYEEFSQGAARLVEEPFWAETTLAGELLSRVARLGELIAGDPELRDESWAIRDLLEDIGDTYRTMHRQVERVALDRPEVALGFIFRQLGEVEPSYVAELLSTSEQTVVALRQGEQRPFDHGRAVFIAQLIYDLRGSMTNAGIILWFRDRRAQLDGHSPLDLLLVPDAIAIHGPTLRGLARAGRGQLAT